MLKVYFFKTTCKYIILNIFLYNINKFKNVLYEKCTN